MNELSLSDEFAASAQKYDQESEDAVQKLLLTKFAILMRHKLTEGADKDAAAAALFDCGIKYVADVALQEKPTAIRDDIVGRIKPVFAALMSPECAQHIPSRAASELATTALDVARKGEAAVWQDFSDWSQLTSFQGTTAALAGMLLYFADQMKETIDRRNENVTTSAPITASKPISLKRANTPA